MVSVERASRGDPIALIGERFDPTAVVGQKYRGVSERRAGRVKMQRGGTGGTVALSDPTRLGIVARHRIGESVRFDSPHCSPRSSRSALPTCGAPRPNPAGTPPPFCRCCSPGLGVLSVVLGVQRPRVVLVADLLVCAGSSDVVALFCPQQRRDAVLDGGWRSRLVFPPWSPGCPRVCARCQCGEGWSWLVPLLAPVCNIAGFLASTAASHVMVSMRSELKRMYGESLYNLYVGYPLVFGGVKASHPYTLS